MEFGREWSAWREKREERKGEKEWGGGGTKERGEIRAGSLQPWKQRIFECKEGREGREGKWMGQETNYKKQGRQIEQKGRESKEGREGKKLHCAGLKLEGDWDGNEEEKRGKDGRERRKYERWLNLLFRERRIEESPAALNTRSWVNPRCSL